MAAIHHSRASSRRLLLFLILVLPSGLPIRSVQAGELPRLPVVEVVAAPDRPESTRSDPATGQNRLDQKTIRALPGGDGTVNELLQTLPGVQVGEQSSSSLQGGEILPPLISISGGKLEQNNFRIDGLGNNSLLDPLANDPSNPTQVPGNPQELFLNSNLVESITVYDHNVPARFGGFTGGVVDVVTRDPRAELGGALHYRTTRDAWTRFHVAAQDQAKFDTPTSATYQPHFTKHEGGVEFDLPLGPHTGLLAAYAINYAQIPLYLLGSEEKQNRRNDNYLLKLVHRPSAAEKVTLQLLHTPYRAHYFIQNTKDSGYTIDGGGTSASIGYRYRPAGAGKLELHGGFRDSENSRQAPTDFLTWKATPSKSWGELVGFTSSFEGGFGDLKTRQRTLEASGDWESAAVAVGDWHHRFGAGLGGGRTTGSYQRPETSYAYKGAKLDSATTCLEGDVACVDGEQWLSTRTVYHATKSTATITQAYLYLDDRQQLGRLELRPGVRLSWDDFTENFNPAPRFATSFDLTGNGRTVLVGGWNRYFGQTLLTYKLREAIGPVETETRATPDPNAWTPKTPIFPSMASYSRLATPYVDELVAGLDQILFGGLVKLRYVQRDGFDEFASEIDPIDVTQPQQIRYSRLNNNGRSHYRSYRLSWERTWSRQRLDGNLSYQENTTTNATYGATVQLQDLGSLVWYDGQPVALEDLPRTDFNRGWTANLAYQVKLPWNFRFSNVTRYRSGYRGFVSTKDLVTYDGQDYQVYEKVKWPSATTFDWRLDWRSPAVGGQTLQLTLEIYNVFDRRNYVIDANQPTVPQYALGRQFWVGAEYAF